MFILLHPVNVFVTLRIAMIIDLIFEIQKYFNKFINMTINNYGE